MNDQPTRVTPLKIAKPTGFMDKFRSKKPPTIAGVDTVLSALKIHRLGDVRDFFQLNPNEEEYWSPELCFVEVPDQGRQKGHATSDR